MKLISLKAFAIGLEFGSTWKRLLSQRKIFSLFMIKITIRFVACTRSAIIRSENKSDVLHDTKFH